MGRGPRKVIHVDMDAFYAQVEQRDRPELRGRPVVVGGMPNSRGVVATASYEARPFGVHSAMPAAQAARLCPDAVFLRPDFAKYKQVSRQLRAVFERYTDLIEPVSLDEAYLDVTEDALGIGSATLVAQRIVGEIWDVTGLSASVGAGPNKFVAKVASDLEKPRGFVIVPPERVAAFVRDLPVGKIPGVGPVGRRRLEARGIATCSDLLSQDERQLVGWFGSWGTRLSELARGVDRRPVVASRTRRSCSVEETFPRDLSGVPAARAVLERLAGELEGRLRKAGVTGRTVTLKVRYADFSTVTRRRTLTRAVRAGDDLAAEAVALLDQTEVAERPIRLLGVGVSSLEDPAGPRQLELFSALH